MGAIFLKHFSQASMASLGIRSTLFNRKIIFLPGNLQSYWNTTMLWKLTVVLDYYEAMETYSRIGLLRSYVNLQSYWTTATLCKLTVVLNYYKAMGTYSRIRLPRSYRNLQSYWTGTKLWKLTVVLDYYSYLQQGSQKSPSQARGTYKTLGPWRLALG